MKVRVSETWDGVAAFRGAVVEVDEIKSWGVVVAMPVDGGVAYARVANGDFTVVEGMAS